LFDIYQRFSLSSHCTAFSYKPVFNQDILSSINFKNNKKRVLRFPPIYCDKVSNNQSYYQKLHLDCSDESDLSSSEE
jgi:hypothetical protein